MKRLEGEVLDLLATLGEQQQRFDAEGLTVDPHQFLGIELNPRAAAIAELVLWIGYLQWHFRTRGNAQPPQPVLKDFANIQRRDGVLEYDHTEVALDAAGKPITRWNGIGFKTHPVTGEQVPDETALVSQLTYVTPRKATWPKADFIVGNPPFIGAAPMRAALGDGYVEALRRTWSDVPSSADFVMYWWQHAAEQVRAGHARRFGLITTNSLRQTFNRRVVEQNIEAHSPLSIVFAIPDHPWVDSVDGAAVRIAMTVCAAGSLDGKLRTVVSERYVAGDDAAQIELAEKSGSIHADLTVGANVSSAKPLTSNGNLSSRGMMLFGAGFIVTRSEANALGLGRIPGLDRHIREYRNGKDLTNSPRDALVIDLYGLTAEETRTRYPEVFQWILERVKPERDANRDDAIRRNWWLHGRTRSEFRPALNGLWRYIATVETAKHRTFQFLDASVLPDNMLVAIGSDDAFHLGVLSSAVHVTWALAAGGTLEDRPRYNKTRCFETFPFPTLTTRMTPEQESRIRDLAEQIDAHRKRQQQANIGITLTGMYNVLDKLRVCEPLTAKEQVIHVQGLVGVLKTLHDELDAAILAAYGWVDLAICEHKDPEGFRSELLQRLVTLNAVRAAEEAAGTVRWLRPSFQDPAVGHGVEIPAQKQTDMELEDGRLMANATQSVPWPKALPDQVREVSAALAAAPLGLPLMGLAAQFKGKGQWRKDLLPILETLADLGRARNSGDIWHQN